MSYLIAFALAVAVAAVLLVFVVVILCGVIGGLIKIGESRAAWVNSVIGLLVLATAAGGGLWYLTHSVHRALWP